VLFAGTINTNVAMGDNGTEGYTQEDVARAVEIAQAKDYLRIAPYMCVIPGIVLALTALSFNLLGDGLRDALDPKLKD